MSIKLTDRIKELSYTIGTGNMILSGSVRGFSSFNSACQHNAEVFYAITDGTFYEIGSGVYKRADYDPNDGITSDQLVRFPITSTNGNNKVNFPEGTKEVYITYPATHAVHNGSGLSNTSVPQNSGLAFWATENIVDYDSKLLWDKTNHRLAINKSNPAYTVDIGGSAAESAIRASGLIVSSSGIYFPSGNNGESSYFGGRQLTHYIRNELDKYAYDRSLIGHLTGSDSVIELSGSANQYILFKQQGAGLVFAGPASGCTPPCSPAYPSFRPLEIEDIPNLDSLYVTETQLVTYSGIVNNRLNGLNSNIVTASGSLNAKIDSSVSNNQYYILNSGILAGSGIQLRRIANSGLIIDNKLSKTIDVNNTSTSITGNVGINYTPRSDCSLAINAIGINSNHVYGNIVSCVNTANNNGIYSNTASYVLSSPKIETSISNSGSSIGSSITNHRNLVYDGDNGSLSNLYGLSLSYGHNAVYASNPTTENAIGLSLSCYALSGTITNAYDLVLSSSGTNATNHWGIFQEAANNNYFAGNIGVGTSSPTAKLDINGDILRIRNSKTPASGNAPGNVGDICWDSNYIYVCVSSNNWKRSDISSW